jgi:hypothetical protein
LFFLDLLNGGAWPLLVGGVICLVDSVNGRDPSCLVGGKIVIRRQHAEVIFWSFSANSLVAPFFAGFQILHLVRFWATAGL